MQIVYAVQFSEPVQEEKLVAETIKTAVVANDHSLAGIQVDTSSIRICKILLSNSVYYQINNNISALNMNMKTFEKKYV